jgi:hypothetical protein
MSRNVRILLLFAAAVALIFWGICSDLAWSHMALAFIIIAIAAAVLSVVDLIWKGIAEL